VRLEHLWLADFRNYTSAQLDPIPDGLTVIRGRNGQGKTNLLEAVGYLATLSSFRGAPKEALVRRGSERAVVRAEGERENRRLLLEAEVPVSGRDRYLMNRQPLRRGRDLLGALRVSVFSPEDLSLVQAGPAGRRNLLDEALVSLHPRSDALRSDVERVLRQRAALLRQAQGRVSAEVESTLAVWDSKLDEFGSRLATEREDLVEALEPRVQEAYQQLSAGAGRVQMSYRRSWTGALGEALVGARKDDLRRGVTTVGPHRDELDIDLAAMPARTHASQGEQRGIALALRLAVHGLVQERVGTPPVLLLDDVFSELDPQRSVALVRLLPEGQALLTTAGPLPEGARPDLVVEVQGGKVLPR
jgi:DNA replication and repair protein RecF